MPKMRAGLGGGDRYPPVPTDEGKVGTLWSRRKDRQIIALRERYPPNPLVPTPFLRRAFRIGCERNGKCQPILAYDHGNKGGVANATAVAPSAQPAHCRDQTLRPTV
uniref:Uncharacterized protein n=1 Tax=viral metagenome TaxID=1070528 RepID=A0A6M3XU92_9ZZZZ